MLVALIDIRVRTYLSVLFELLSGVSSRKSVSYVLSVRIYYSRRFIRPGPALHMFYTVG